MLRTNQNAPEIVFKTRMIGNFINSLSVRGTVMVTGNPCEMILDTGSNITIIRSDVLRHREAGKLQVWDYIP